MNIPLLLLALQTAPVSGELTAVSPDEKRVRVGLGRDSGLKVQDTLRIYSAPEIVSLPGTARAAFGVEREIAAAVVVEVLDRELVAQIVNASEPPSRGNRIVSGKPVTRGPLPPHIRETVTLDPPSAPWGRVVTVGIDVEDLDRDLLRVECRVDKGLLLESSSTAPRVRWLPPAEAGEAKLTVRAIDRAGLADERTFVLRAGGLASEARPKGFLVEATFDTAFIQAADLAPDAEGNLYLLDPALRRVVKWGPAGQRAWVSDAYPRDVEFTRLVVAGTDGVFLDRLGRRALRYPLGPSMFGAEPTRVYGGQRRGPSALREATDLAVVPEGDVWILDAEEGTIRTFAEDGTYQTTVGRFENAKAVRRGAGSAMHILDLGRRQIVTFEAGRILRRTPLPGTDLPVDFLDPADLLFPGGWGNRELSGARAVRRDALGRTFVIDGAGRALLRITPAAPDARRLAGERPSASTVRALPDGGFALEDGETRWTYDAEGWLKETGSAAPSAPRRRDAAGNAYSLADGVLKCGAAPLELSGITVADFDLDPFGRVLVLEEGTGRVLRLRVGRWSE